MREVFKNVETFLHKFVRVQYDKSICIICINFNNTQNFPFCGISNSELKLLLHYIRLRGKMKRSFGLQTNMACSHIIRLVFGRYWFQIKPFRDFPQSIEEMQE